ncbi:MAG: crotonase/enoyl-CoA hydratase family protein [Gallionella sp.]|nr:crotonase/enoyl-CoA hydratase family protein [Gallionella sp.]
MGTVEFLSNTISPIKIQYDQVATRFDHEQGISWIEMKPEGVPCCTEEFLAELGRYNKSIENSGGKILVGNVQYPVNYSVVGSLVPGVFNFGGHLGLFSQLIKNKNRDGLLAYATKCIDVIHSRVNHYNLPLVTISLVQGDALGGGFEAALSSDIIIAERSAKMGFPEILFNLFPGMGAYSFLARKIGCVQAERVILSGKLYSAEELHEMGLVDVLVENGFGEQAVYDYVEKQARRSNGYIAVQKARQRFNPITYQELMDITNVWVDSALKLNEKDLKVMDRFVRSQQKLFESIERTNSDNAKLTALGA